MQRNRRKLSLTTIGQVALAAIFFASPANAIEPWKVALSDQLAEEHGCILQEFLSLREFNLGEKLILEGRIRCLDEREFDYEKKEKHLRFEIKLCEPVYC